MTKAKRIEELESILAACRAECHFQIDDINSVIGPEPDPNYTFYFYSPLDQSPICFKTLREAEDEALKTLGSEDWEGELVTRLAIHRSEKICDVVSVGGPAPKEGRR